MRNTLLFLLAGCYEPGVNSWSPTDFPPASIERVVFLGDSITSRPGYRQLLVNNDNVSWPTFDGEDLNTIYSPSSVINKSSGGRTTSHLAGQVNSLASHGTDGHTVVFVTIGGNDVRNNLGSPDLLTVPDNFETRVSNMITDLESLYPDGVSISVATIYDPTDGVGQIANCFGGADVSAGQTTIDDINARLLSIAQAQDIALVDMYGHFLGHGWNHDDASLGVYHSDDPTRWLGDCLHPNARGSHETRRLFWAALHRERLPVWIP